MRGSKRKRGKNSWELTIPIKKNPDGTWERIYRTFHGTGPQADEELSKIGADIANGNFVDTKNLTFGEFLDRWLSTHVIITVRPSTYEWYKMIVEKHIKPNLGGVLMSKLSPLHLQQYYMDMLKKGRLPKKKPASPIEGETASAPEEPLKGLSANMVRGHHRTIHKALEVAVRWGLAAKNISDNVDPPRSERKEFKTLNEEEIDKFLESAETSRNYVLYLAAISTGLRLGELLGLRWSDVDQKNGAIYVRQALKRSGKEPSFAAPKTKRGTRQVVMTATLAEELKSHKARQNAERLQAGEFWAKDEFEKDYDLVFADHLGAPLRRDWISKEEFKRILKKSKIDDMRFHDLRHSCATILLKEGIHPKIVSEMLGHSTIGITMDTYSHVIPSLQKEAAQKMDTIVKRKTQA